MRSSSTINPPRAVLTTIAPGGRRAMVFAFREVMRLFRLGSVKAQKLTHAEKFRWIGMENRISRLFVRKRMEVRVVDSHPKGAGTFGDGFANSSHA